MMATGVHDYKGVGLKIEDYSKFNYPGHWLPDNLPPSKQYENDKHFHFIAYGSYSPTVTFPRGGTVGTDNPTYPNKPQKLSYECVKGLDKDGEKLSFIRIKLKIVVLL
jgi:hypothetical protein